MRGDSAARELGFLRGARSSSGEDSPRDDLTSAALRTWAAMAWPDDAERRDQFMATLGALAIDHLRNAKLDAAGGGLDRAALEVSRSRVIAQYHKHAFLPYGGEGTVAHAPGWSALIAEIGKHAPKWWATGSILILVRVMHEQHQADLTARRGASVLKAVEWIERTVNSPHVPHNRKDVLAAWSSFKSVAHLCAAFLMIREACHQQNPDAPEEAYMVLVTQTFFRSFWWFIDAARQFQDFGLSFRSHGQMGSMLNASTLWRIPDGLGLEPARINLQPMPEEQLAILRNYRAPKRF